MRGDAKAQAIWKRICDEADQTDATWTDKLRAAGIKLAHPDDGWVNRERSTFTLSWYPLFNDKPEVGDLVAFGRPTDMDYYRSRQDVWPVRRRERDRFRREQAQWHASRPESASDGYRICRIITPIDTYHGSLGYTGTSFSYEDTGIRLPPRRPAIRNLWGRP